jgi:hypothetical protein
VEELHHPPDELLLGTSAEGLLGDPFEDGVRDVGRSANRRQLPVVLEGAERFDEPEAGDELDAAGAEELVVGVAQRGGFEADAVGEAPGQVGVDMALRLLELRVRDLSRPLRVPEVREDPDALGLDEDRGVRALEARQVENVGRSRDEQRLLQQGEQSFYARMRNSSASL